MILSSLSPVIWAIMSEIPQGTGNAVSGPGVNGQPLSAPSGGTETPGGVVGVEPNAPTGGQPSPPAANIPIEDGRFYVLDASRPDEGVMGLQLREAMHRGLQVDNLTSQLHNTQNQNTTLLQRAEAAEAQLAEINRQRELTTSLTQLGFGPQQGGVQPNPGSAPMPQGQGVAPIPQQGTDDPALALLQQQWRQDDGLPGAFGLPEGAPADPNAVPQGTVDPNGVPQGTIQSPGQPVTQTQNQPILNPAQFAESLMPVLDRMVQQRLSGVTQQLNSANQQGFQNLRQEWANRDSISTALNDSRNMRSATLQQQGLPQEQAKNILDLEDMSRLLERQAEELITAGNTVAGRQKLVEAGTLQSQAITARTQAQVNFQNNQAMNTFEQQIETDPFAALGVTEPGEMANNLTDPKAIQLANDTNFNKAAELVESRARIDSTAGVM